MKELRRKLGRQLSRLEAQKELLEGTIAEIHRRYTVLEDVESWNLVAAEEITQENGMDHLSEFGEQEVESSEGAVQQREPETELGWDMGETPTFDANGLPLRARDTFKKQTLPT